MTLSPDRFHLLARLLGGALVFMGVSLLGVFAAFVVADVSLLPPPLAMDGPALVILGSIGAFTLPLGLSLFGRDTRTTHRLRVAGGALLLMGLIRLVAFLDPGLRAVLGLAPLVEFFVLGSLGMVGLLARPRGESPIELQNTFDIEAPAEAVWEAIGGRFGAVDQIASGVRSSSMEGPARVGAVRHCQSEPFGPFDSAHITEELVHYDPVGMRFAYVAGGELPAFIPSSRNRWSIAPLDAGRCRVRGHASVDLAWWATPLAPLIGWSIRPAILSFGRDLQVYMGAGRALEATPAAP